MQLNEATKLLISKKLGSLNTALEKDPKLAVELFHNRKALSVFGVDLSAAFSCTFTHPFVQEFGAFLQLVVTLSTMKAGIDINSFDDYGSTMLSTAIIKGSIHKAKELLDQGADITLHAPKSPNNLQLASEINPEMEELIKSYWPKTSN